jgi:hypothetical protein
VPPELLLQQARTEIDYNRTSFSGKSYLIPASAEVLIVFQGGEEHRDQIRFSNCRKYSSDATISFQ